MRIIDITHPPQSLWIGREGENTFRPVSFECANWFTAYPNATIAAYYQPYGVIDPYPLVLTVDGTKRIWHPLLAELVKGDGELQIVLMNGDVVGTSAIIPTRVDRSLISGADHPAEDAPSWTVQVVQDVTEQADRAEEAASHYPKIVNGVWYVWSVQAEDFVSTGIEAQGEDGYSPTVTVTEIEGGHRVTITDADGAHTFDVMDGEGGSGGGAVESVNGKTGVVVLDASDVGALPDDTQIPSKTSDLTNNSGFVTAQQAAASAPVQSVNGKTGAVVLGAADVGAYVKPSGGIPASDLASAVQTSLGKADTAVQPSEISGMATESYVQTQIAAIPDELPPVTSTDNGKVLAVNNGEWSADSPVIVSGTDAQVTNAVNDYLTQYGVPLRLSEEIKQALLDCFENVAWINDDGQTYYDALYAALYPPADVLSISAVFTQGSAVIYDTDSLDTLKQYLVVTATMTDSTTQTVTNYTLSGTLTVGTSTITVTYGGKTTTFNVTVTHATRNTTAEIAESGKILVRNGEVFPITNGCYTIKYDMPSSTNVLYPSGAIPTKSNEVIYSSGASVIVYDSNGTAVNYVNEFDRWAQEESGTLTDFSQSWTLTDPYSKIAFSLDERYLDRAYMYDKTTGHIWFAGVNTPYYGMSNISEASA